MQRRFAILLSLAVLGVAGVAIAQSRHSETPQSGKAPSTTSTSSTSGTTTAPPPPTTTQPRLPPNHQHVPGKTPPPAGGPTGLSDAEQRQQLEAFLATRPALVPFESAIWYSAHYSYSNVTARGLAGLVWCVGFRIQACDRAQDAAAQR